MKARPISPYRAEIRQLEEQIEDLRRLDAEWRRDRRNEICRARATSTLGKVARRYGISRPRVAAIVKQGC